MKKLIIGFICLSAVLSIHSELKYFLPDSNAYFSVSWYKFWFEGDTVINNISYKKVFSQWGETPDFNYAYYYAAVREDTIAERIYCYHKYDEQEYLIADFSGEPGDILTVFNYFYGDSRNEIEVEIESVDEILIDGNYRKRINIVDRYGVFPESWIEGIGSTNGLFFPGNMGIADIGTAKLICIHVNNELYFRNCEDFEEFGYCEKCYFNDTAIKHTFINKHATVTEDKLYVSIRDNALYNYAVYDSSGAKIAEGASSSDYIDVSSLKQGLYFMQLSYGKAVESFKFIKL